MTDWVRYHGLDKIFYPSVKSQISVSGVQEVAIFAPERHRSNTTPKYSTVYLASIAVPLQLIVKIDCYFKAAYSVVEQKLAKIDR